MSSINKCKRCKNSVQSGLKCIICGVVSHKSCLNVLKGIKFLDDTTVNCCSEAPVDMASGSASNKQEQPVLCSDLTNSAPANSVSVSVSGIEEIKIKYLEELLRQKDLTILNQSIAINSLQEQVAYLKRELKLQEKVPLDNDVVEEVSEGASYASKAKQGAATAYNKNKNRNKNVQNKAPIISSAAVSHSVHLAQAQRVCQDLINLNKDTQDTPGQSVPQENMQRRTSQVSRKKSRNILVGDGQPDTNLLKSAKFIDYKHFHSTYWDPETDVGELTDYLRRFIPEVQVEKLNSRNPTRYASFKISVPSAEAHKIIRPEIWPSGVLLNQFFRSFHASVPNKPE